MSAGIPGAVCPGLFAEKVIEWLYWDIPQFGVLRSRTLLARAEALSCYANVASRFLVLTRTPCVQPWLASSSHTAPEVAEERRTTPGRSARREELVRANGSIIFGETQDLSFFGHAPRAH